MYWFEWRLRQRQTATAHTVLGIFILHSLCIWALCMRCAFGVHESICAWVFGLTLCSMCIGMNRIALIPVVVCTTTVHLHLLLYCSQKWRRIFNNQCIHAFYWINEFVFATENFFIPHFSVLFSWFDIEMDDSKIALNKKKLLSNSLAQFVNFH